MPEGEGPRPPQTESKLGPNPIFHTPDGGLRRRNDPHGLTRAEQAWIYFERGARRFDILVNKLTEPAEPAQSSDLLPQKDVPTNQAIETSPEPQHIEPAGVENHDISEDDPLRFGSDVPSSTIRVMRALNWIGGIGRSIADRILGPREDLPLVRRPEYQYKHDMRVQKGTSAPSSVRVVEPEKEPPYDWNDPKRGAPEFQDNPVIDTTESTPDSTSSK